MVRKDSILLMSLLTTAGGLQLLGFYPLSYILMPEKIGNLNINTKIFDFDARILIGWLLQIMC